MSELRLLMPPVFQVATCRHAHLAIPPITKRHRDSRSSEPWVQSHLTLTTGYWVVESIDYRTRGVPRTPLQQLLVSPFSEMEVHERGPLRCSPEVVADTENVHIRAGRISYHNLQLPCSRFLFWLDVLMRIHVQEMNDPYVHNHDIDTRHAPYII
jgi:hypothetical protein